MISWGTVKTIGAYLILFVLCATALSFTAKNGNDAEFLKTTTETNETTTDVVFDISVIYDVPLSKELQEHTQNMCEKYSVPHDLAIAVMYVESGYDINAVNGDCIGLMQVNTINLEELTEIDITDLSDPKQNIEAGVYLLRKALTSNNITFALMCYNCGEAKAEEMREKGIYSTNYTRKVLQYAVELTVKERIYEFENVE